MSSPMSFGGPASASTPDAGAGGPEEMDGLSTRPMKLKVLYSFDDQNKTNCLARWPQVINVQTVSLDDGTAIGVIELKTCIQAIVSASPELVAKLGQDFTVYAFDYSEYETPLVGQGMLSWALASASPTPHAPAHQSRTIITGRVCKNIMGLFANGVKETLEVKLRLVPVPTCLQSEYVDSMDRYRELSKIMPSGFDSGAWTAFLKANPGLGALASGPQADGQQRPPSGMGQSILTHLVESSMSPQPSDPLSQRMQPNVSEDSYFGGFQPEAYGSNAPSPAPSNASPAPVMQEWHDVRSGAPSRASARGPYDSPQPNVDDDMGQDPPTQEEGPARKRAKVMRAEWKGKSSFGKSSEPLRVAASTAASMRLHRPIAMKPSNSAPGSHLVEIPRVPTPRPQDSEVQVPSLRVGERRESVLSAYSPLAPPGSEGQSSPEPGPQSPFNEGYNSNANTPANIASSPPMMQQDAQSIPSSPNLPVLQPDMDSGFMSGNMDDLFEADDDMRPVFQEQRPPAAVTARRKKPTPGGGIHFQQENPGPAHLLPRKILPRPPDSHSKALSSAFGSSEAGAPPPNRKGSGEPKPPSRSRSKSKSQAGSTESSDVSTTQSNPQPRALPAPPTKGTLTLPAVPASDPVMPPTALQRSQTWSVGEFPRSDGPGMTQGSVESRLTDLNGQPRSGSGAKRRKAIQRKLANAIQSGKMPPFCENCGAIETATWRKAYKKVIKGSSEGYSVSEEEGGIFAIVPHLDEDGNEESVSLLKRTLNKEDEGYAVLQLCNPCGLWLFKVKSFRPPEKWNKDPNAKKKAAKKKQPQPAAPVKSESADSGPNADDGPTPNDGSGPSDNDDLPATNTAAREATTTAAAAAAASNKPRAASVELAMGVETKGSAESSWNDAHAMAALHRAIQSSPVRLRGTAASPIDLSKDELGSTRRLLFPSPSKGNASKTLQDVSPSRAERRLKEMAAEQPTLEISWDPADKENQPPVAADTSLDDADDDDDIMRLFEDRSLNEATTPTRTTPRSGTRTFKTPNKPVTPQRQTRRPGNSPWRSDIFCAHGGGDMLLPPRTPSTRDRSPRGAGSVPPKPSPFTVQLQQILSEANMGPSGQEWADFPPLEGFLPCGNDERATPSKSTALHLPDLNLEDVLSTDVPMPSSPPPPFFELYEDPVDPESALWTDYDIQPAQD